MRSHRRRRRARIRPYTFTGGRTRSRHPLMVQTLVSIADEKADPPQHLMPESERIYRLCAQVRSVAEISAGLTLPLGVTPVLLSDVAAQGRGYIPRAL